MKLKSYFNMEAPMTFGGVGVFCCVGNRNARYGEKLKRGWINRFWSQRQKEGTAWYWPDSFKRVLVILFRGS